MHARLIFGFILMTVVVIFTLQNTEVVDLRFVVWTVSAPRAMVIFFVLAIGIVIGWILHSWAYHRKLHPPAVDATQTS